MVWPVSWITSSKPSPLYTPPEEVSPSPSGPPKSFIRSSTSILKITPRSEVKYSVKTASKVVSLFRHSTASLLKAFGKMGGRSAKALSSMKMISVITLPFAVMDLRDDSKAIYSSKSKIDKLESGLDAASDTGAIMDGVVGITIGAMALHALRTGIEFSTPLWAEVLGFVGFGFQLFTVASCTSGIIRTFHCVHEMDKRLTNPKIKSEEQVSSAMQFLLDKQERNSKYIKRKFRLINGTDFQNVMAFRVKQINRLKGALEIKENPQDRADLEKLVKESSRMMRQFKWRAYGQIGLKLIKIGAVAAGAIAMVVMMCTPYGYIGYAILAVTTCVVIAAATGDFVMLKRGHCTRKKKLKRPPMPFTPPATAALRSTSRDDKERKPRKRVRFQLPWSQESSGSQIPCSS